MFGGAVSTIFGEEFVKRVGEGTLRAHFQTFESGFELAASPLPLLFQPAFCRARGALLAALRHLPHLFRSLLSPPSLPPCVPLFDSLSDSLRNSSLCSPISVPNLCPSPFPSSLI